MPSPTVQTFPDLEDLSRRAAEALAQRAMRKAALGGTFTLALSGGSTPKRLCELLASPEFSPKVPWDGVEIFQVDERCVPPDHPESNYRMIRQALLERVPAAQRHFHRMPAERADLDEAAREYAREIAEHVEVTADWPRFDLILLGMGTDGHTASLFPGSPALAEQRLWVRPNYVDKLKAHRLTLTLPVLNAAAEVIFLVAGEDKAGTLQQVLEGPPGRFPAQDVRPRAGQLWWYVDQAAASRLSPATLNA
jgi:6-phosphogluconolactonase